MVFGDRFNYIELRDILPGIDRFNYIELRDILPGIPGLSRQVVSQDRWSLKAVVSQDRLYCKSVAFNMYNMGCDKAPEVLKVVYHVYWCFLIEIVLP